VSVADRPVAILVERELRTRLRDRTFRISTVVSLVVIVGLAVLPKVFGGGTSTWEIGAVGADASGAARLAAAVAPDGREASVVELDAASAEAAVRAGEVDVALLADGSLLADEDVPDALGALLQGAWRQHELADALVDAGVDPLEAERIAASPERPVRLLDPPDEERDRRVGFLVVGIILLYGQLIGYGFMVASGVVEEKSTRVVEVLLAKVRTRDLLVSKILGIGAIGVAQLATFVLVGLVAFRLADRFELPSGVWPSAVALLAWFLLGFVFYAALFAVAGALAARAEDLQSSSGPITLVVVLSFLGAVTAAGDTGSTLAQVLSFVPTTAPMVMPVRTAAGDAGWLDVVASVAIVVASGLLLVRLADVVYRRAALRTGARSRLRAVLRGT